MISSDKSTHKLDTTHVKELPQREERIKELERLLRLQTKLKDLHLVQSSSGLDSTLFNSKEFDFSALYGDRALAFLLEHMKVESPKQEKRIFWMTERREVYGVALEQYGINVEKILFLENTKFQYPVFLAAIREAIQSQVFYSIVVDDSLCLKMDREWLKDQSIFQAFQKKFEILLRSYGGRVFFIYGDHQPKFSFRQQFYIGNERESSIESRVDSLLQRGR